ncbi:MAG: hypothetical protein H6737_28750 [Alphaproteobacteria bacterium]|nr:hypothetical protein [Alphaproteobacteria bacterium]
MWFETLMGFAERSPDQVRESLVVDGDRMTSRVNGRTYGCGRLAIPTLAALRSAVARSPRSGRPTLVEVVGDARAQHADPANAGATFQAASQFNLLEMASPHVTPEAGVGIYESDPTQGPACAVSCGAGTIFRNYFVPLDGQLGQTRDRQVDCLAGVGAALGAPGAYWTMVNGYALLTPCGRTEMADHIRSLDEAGRDALRAALCVGVHSDVEVTLPGAGHRVTQVYGAALALGYGQGQPAEWEPLATVVLEASYEATLLAAALNAAETGNRRVLLTLLGGGVFGNAMTWITGAIDRALDTPGIGDLDVQVVSFRRSSTEVRTLVERRT